MATTVLGNVAYIPEVFNGYVTNMIYKKSNFFTSDAVVLSNALLPLYGKTIHMPGWAGLTGGANVLGDGCQTSEALTSTDQIAAILERGKVWGVNGLVNSFTGSKPLEDNIADHIAAFWAREIDTAAIKSAIGAANGITADGTAMVLDISTLTGGLSSVSARALIQTRALAGEYMNDFNILVVHSAIYASLQAADLTQFIPNSQGVPIERFMGMQVVVNDSVTANAGVYDSLLVRNGAFGFAENTDPNKAVEEDRDVKCNEDILSIQKRFVIHPFGAKFDGSVAGATATNAELSTSNKWSLAGDANAFGIRVLRSEA